MPVAFELTDNIHEMLEDTRTRDTAVLRDVPDQQGRQIGFLCDPDKGTGDSPHLGDAARPALDLRGEDGLHRVHDEQGRTHGLDVPKDDSEIRLIGDQQVRLQGTNPLSAPAHLRS